VSTKVIFKTAAWIQILPDYQIILVICTSPPFTIADKKEFTASQYIFAKSLNPQAKRTIIICFPVPAADQCG
jgi:hypothetical protein